MSKEAAWGAQALQRAAETLGVPGPVTFQNSDGLVSRSVNNDLAEVMQRERMTLLAYSPLDGGMLTGKYLGGNQPAASRYSLFDGLGARFRKPIVSEAIAEFAGVARDCDLTLTQLALGYVKSRWYLGASIIGATSVTQLAENIAAAQLVLDSATLEAIARVHIRFPNPSGV